MPRAKRLACSSVGKHVTLTSHSVDVHMVGPTGLHCSSHRVLQSTFLNLQLQLLLLCAACIYRRLLSLLEQLAPVMQTQAYALDSIAFDSGMCCCQLPAKLNELCRYDRSLWPADGVAANHSAIPSSASQGKGLQINSETPALGKDSVKHLRQRMATVLDVELCNAA